MEILLSGLAGELCQLQRPPPPGGHGTIAELKRSFEVRRCGGGGGLGGGREPQLTESLGEKLGVFVRVV